MTQSQTSIWGSLDQISGIFTKIISIGIYTLVFEIFSIITIEINWVSFAILFILYDLCYYWSHRMAHTVSLFWGGHVVHHQSEDFNLSVALRQSSTQFLWSLPFYLPLAFIGFSPLQFVFVIGWNLIYQFWIHTEHIDRLPKWFEYIMNSPSHHRVHHGRDPKYINKNYAGVFIIWDRMFQTFVKEEERPHYGITKPLNSWNPIYANFNHYVSLFKTVRKAKGLKDGLKILFLKPGWQPEYLSGYLAPYSVSDNYKKYDATKHHTSFLWYIFIQFLVTLGLISFFLFNQESLNTITILIFVIWFLMTIVMFSLFFEVSGSWLIFIEAVRLAIIPFGIKMYISFSFEFHGLIFGFFTIYGLLSILWYVTIVKPQNKRDKH